MDATISTTFVICVNRMGNMVGYMHKKCDQKDIDCLRKMQVKFTQNLPPHLPCFIFRFLTVVHSFTLFFIILSCFTIFHFQSLRNQIINLPLFFSPVYSQRRMDIEGAIVAHMCKLMVN